MEGKGEEVIDDDDGYMYLVYDREVGGAEGERDKRNKGSRDISHFTPSFQCRQTDIPFFALLFPPSFTS